MPTGSGLDIRPPRWVWLILSLDLKKRVRLYGVASVIRESREATGGLSREGQWWADYPANGGQTVLRARYRKPSWSAAP